MDIREFAGRLGLSPTTISHALTGKRPVKAATRQLILEKMAEWNYTPNINARRLVSSRTNLIAFFSEAGDTLADPYQLELIRNFCRLLRRRGYDLLLDLYHAEEPDPYISLRTRVASHAADGSIIIGRGLKQEDFDTLAAPHCPCVHIDDVLRRPHAHAAMLAVDCRQAYTEAVRLLCELRRPRILLLARHEGDHLLDQWREILKAFGLAAAPELCVYSEESPEDARNAVLPALLRPERPQAILARTDAQAQGALKAAAELRLRVPQDLSILGHGDVHYSRDTTPQLATVSFDYRKLAECAVAALFQLLDQPGKAVAPVLFEGRLLLRGSLV